MDEIAADSGSAYGAQQQQAHGASRSLQKNNYSGAYQEVEAEMGTGDGEGFSLDPKIVQLCASVQVKFTEE